MTLKQFIKKYNGKKVDWDGAFGGQCVDLFRQYCNDVLKIAQPKSVRGAKDFWANYSSDTVLNKNFDKVSNTRSLIAKDGDVVIWGSGAGEYGHVAIAIEGDIDRFSSFDQNWKKLSVCEVIEHNYKNVLGVLRVKKEEDIERKERELQEVERLKANNKIKEQALKEIKEKFEAKEPNEMIKRAKSGGWVMFAGVISTWLVIKARNYGLELGGFEELIIVLLTAVISQITKHLNKGV